jgi:hypothetical protein
MTTPDGHFDRDRIIELLTELGSRLGDQGIRAEMFIVGGAAMALAYNRERLTRDIDAVFEPKSLIYAEARRIAAEKGIPEDWLNDGVKGFLPDHPDTGAQTLFVAPGISVSVASPEFVFAMKAAAARVEEDTEDIELLARVLGITTSREALGIVERFYNRARLSPKTQFILQEMFDVDEALANASSRVSSVARSPRQSKVGTVRCPKVNKDGARCSRRLLPGSSCPAHGWKAPRQQE